LLKGWTKNAIISLIKQYPTLFDYNTDISEDSLDEQEEFNNLDSPSSSIHNDEDKEDVTSLFSI
jgi:hypothetical protein